MALAENLTKLRKAAGLTRKEVAVLLGIPYPTLRNYEMGEREPGLATLQELADFFGVGLDELIGGERGLSEEALQLARDYDRLDARGRRALRALADAELKEVEGDGEGQTGILFRWNILPQAGQAPGRDVQGCAGQDQGGDPEEGV